MNRTKIEWVRNPDGSQGYTWNPIKGLCPVGCPYCYARGFYKRFKWNPEIRLDKKELVAPRYLKKPSGIFIGSTIEMYHPQIPYEWINSIIPFTYEAPEHIYLTLTKMPENLKSFKFPEWWWVGVTITGEESYAEQVKLISDLKKAECTHRFISFEPLLGAVNIDVLIELATKSVNWVIVGLQTPNRASTAPLPKWVVRIVRYCRLGKIPIFLKNNLKPIMGDLIQEFPE